jgi:hypothetical protein
MLMLECLPSNGHDHLILRGSVDLAIWTIF